VSDNPNQVKIGNSVSVLAERTSDYTSEEHRRLERTMLLTGPYGANGPFTRCDRDRAERPAVGRSSLEPDATNPACATPAAGNATGSLGNSACAP
jgi:hypothetical protein